VTRSQVRSGRAHEAEAEVETERRWQADETEVVPVLSGQGPRGRLQERRSVAAIHLGAGQDSFASHYRRVPQASAAGGRRGQARAWDGVASLRLRCGATAVKASL